MKSQILLLIGLSIATVQASATAFVCSPTGTAEGVSLTLSTQAQTDEYGLPLLRAQVDRDGQDIAQVARCFFRPLTSDYFCAPAGSNLRYEIYVKFALTKDGAGVVLKDGTAADVTQLATILWTGDKASPFNFGLCLKKAD